MQIKVKIDQKACLAKGLDAPASYYLATISPATLPVDVRTWLSQHMLDEITVSCLSFAVPKPTQGDIEQKILKQIQLEQAHRVQEQTAQTNLLKLLNEEQCWLITAGLLPDEAVLKAIANNLHLKLVELSQTLAPSLTLTSLQLTIVHTDPCKPTPTLIWQPDQTHEVTYAKEPNTCWRDSASASWIPFIKAAETMEYKVLQVLRHEQTFKVELKPKIPIFSLQIAIWLHLKTA